MWIGTILPIFKELGNIPLIKQLLNKSSKTGAMTDADILTIFMGISSGPAHLLTFSCWMLVRISDVVIGLKKKELHLFAQTGFVENMLVAVGLLILSAIFCPISEK